MSERSPQRVVGVFTTGLRCLPMLASLVLLQACDSGADTKQTSQPPATAPAVPVESGLNSRPRNDTCNAWDKPNAGSTVSVSRYTDLAFDGSLAMLQAPHSSTHWYVVQQGSTDAQGNTTKAMVKRFSVASPASTTTFIDLSGRVTAGGEMGLLGMAFHPDFPTDKRVFLSYTALVGNQLVSRISSFVSNDSGVTLDPASESILLVINQPENNHNGGNIAFGADGYLYIGMGDGGGGGDGHGTDGNGQRLTTMLGKMLRIDINTPPYGIPAGNPFATNAQCPAAGRASGECRRTACGSRSRLLAHELRAMPSPWRPDA